MLTLYALPPGMTYDEMQSGELNSLEFLQASGMADAMTVEICEPGSPLWAELKGATWWRSAIGHPHDGEPPLDVALHLPERIEMVSRLEVFTADEAAKIFLSYYTAEVVPSTYSLRDVGVYGEDDTHLSLRAGTDADEVSRQVYRGDIPGDLYYGRWPNRLTIYAKISSGGFTLTAHDSVDWPDKDQYWTMRIAPDQLRRLRDVLGAAPDMDADGLLDLVAARFEDRTIPVRGVASWLKESGIAYRVSQQFLEN
jgi:hypothetical protein